MGTTGQSITLANSIIGVGILAMPFCFQQCGVLLATLILLLMGLVSRLCCYFLLKSALIAKRRNFEYLAFHVFGSTGKLAVEVGIIGFLMGTCIAYFVVVGDLGPQIIAKMFNINQSDILRTSIMVIVSVVCVLPLGLLRNVDSLSNVSAATIGFYFCLVIKVIIDASSQMSSDLPSRVEMWKPSGVLQCVPIFSMALFCQTQLFEIFESMPSLSLEKMNVVTKNAINICTAVYFTLGLFGYIAFSSRNISGNILMSLSPTMASDVIKLGFVMSVAFSFPLIIFPCRASVYSFLYKKVHLFHHDHIVNNSIPEVTFRCITVAIVAVTLLISLMLPNIELVLGLVGSTIGVMICVIFPAACFVNVTFKNTNERVLAKGIMALGLVIMVLGTYANLQAAESNLDRYDDKFTQERIDKIVEDFFESKKLEKHKDLSVSHEEQPVKLDDIELKKEANRDSEVQPPNPVPPDSLSDEKVQKPIVEKISDDQKDTIKLKSPKLDEKPDTILDTHPKNLNGKLIDEKVINGKPKPDEIDKPKEVVVPSDQDKMDRIKQQQLIETIKQHGEEQKELIKEQKEILDEIIKTKKEMQEKKDVDDSIKAKKIAVESIQKIANMAIRSISGVSEKPGDKKEIVNKDSKAIAHDAVQEIAKKTVETLEAIKDDNIKPGLPQPDAKNAVDNPIVLQPQADHESQPINPNQIVKKLDAILDIIDHKVGRNNVQPVINKLDQSAMNGDTAPKKLSASELKPIELQKPQKLSKKMENVVEEQHSHLPDEPQSYKQGEDSQKDTFLNPGKNYVIPKVPMPLIKNSKEKYDIKAETVELKQDSKIQNVYKDTEIKHLVKDAPINGAQKEGVHDQIHARQKRAVIDCTEKAILKPEDKEICKTDSESLSIR